MQPCSQLPTPSSVLYTVYYYPFLLLNVWGLFCPLQSTVCRIQYKLHIKPEFTPHCIALISFWPTCQPAIKHCNEHYKLGAMHLSHSSLLFTTLHVFLSFWPTYQHAWLQYTDAPNCLKIYFTESSLISFSAKLTWPHSWSPNSTYLHLDFYYMSTYKYKRHSRAICYWPHRPKLHRVAFLLTSFTSHAFASTDS